MNRRTKATRISVFNHKGGVGKTTLTVNIAAALADMGRRILLVDSDPQCNLTAYLVDGEVVDDLLDHSDGMDGATVWSALKPVHEALGGFSAIPPIETGLPNIHLLPGDIRLSEFETDLAEFWGQCLQRKMRGFRGTTALSELINQITLDLNIDYVFYDSGPNIGPLNRVILLDCDFFVVPVACDLFSLRALKTLGRTLVDWIRQWSNIVALAPEDTYLLPGCPAMLGYIPEGFRVYGGMSRGHSGYLAQIEKEIHSQVITLLREVNSQLAQGRMRDFRLGEVKHFGALVPASLKEGQPLYKVDAGSPTQREAARKVFASIAHKIDTKTRGKGA